MNNLQVGNGYIIFEGLAPDLAQGFGAAGGVGGAGAGQLDRRDAGHRQQILCIGDGLLLKEMQCRSAPRPG